jgi:uncharacterized protein YndB with AHSA1/START domain
MASAPGSRFPRLAFPWLALVALVLAACAPARPPEAVGQAHAQASEGAAPSAATGFEIKFSVSIAAPPDRVYRSIVDVASWWDPEHTYSGSASNLRLEAHPGGCFCETLADGGGVQHMTVAYVAPGKRLVLRGALGPLQTYGAAGAMTWLLDPKGSGTDLAFTYDVGGHAPNGLAPLAGPVEAVLRAQVERLKRYAEGSAR